MPLLGPTDLLPHPPRRVVIAGTSGSGKTTLAARIGAALALPHVEIDGLFHGPQWNPRPEFVADVESFTSAQRWVTEWQYSLARALLAERADTLVWLDYPRPLVMWRVSRRTVRRRLRRLDLWNGNREGPLWRIFADRDHIVRWAWRTHPKTAQRVHDLLAGPDRDRLTIVRLRGPRDTRRWLHGPLALAGGSGPGTDNEEER